MIDRGSASRAVQLVVNGDDFGYSEAINAAIVRCHRAGVLTSATVLVNRPATSAALALARELPELGLGLHLNLTEGAPVSPPREVPTLVDGRGRFRPFPAQLRRIASGRARPVEVERELRAQFAVLLGRGVRPTHVDGHLHVHAYPRVLPVVLRLMREYGVPAMRSPVLAAWAPLHLAAELAAWPGLMRKKRLVAARWPGRHTAWLRTQGIVVADYLLDAARFRAARDPVALLRGALAPLRRGTVELMAHPAWTRSAALGAAEVAFLTDPRLREMLAELGVALRHYGQLGKHSPAARR